MSGGYFDGKERELIVIKDWLEELKNEREKWLEEDYSEEVMEWFDVCIENLKEGYMYLHHIDYLLSGDISEDYFLESLEELEDEGYM